MSGLLKTRTIPLLVTAALTVTSVIALGVPTASAVAVAHFSYQGDAYGSVAYVGGVVTSGRTAEVGIGCGTLGGVHKTNATAGVSLAPLLTTGTVATTADSVTSPVTAKTSATTQSVSLLGGLVTATAVKAASATSNVSGVFSVSAAGTTFTNLVVAGVPVLIQPAPNTRIDILGFGHLILNEQNTRINATSASFGVNAIHLFITTANVLNIAPNTNVVVSHADSGLVGPRIGVLDGRAYGTSATALTVVNSGPSFPEAMPCDGTNGVLLSNTGVGVNVPNAVVTGTITDTVQGTITATTATGETTSTVQSANVLSGLVSATVIKADAHAFTDGTVYTFSDTGSMFATLSVAGFPAINASVAANTTLVLPGVGTLYLHRVIHTGRSIEVRMIELVLTSATGGLPIGTDIRVAVASASAH